MDLFQYSGKFCLQICRLQTIHLLSVDKVVIFSAQISRVQLADRLKRGNLHGFLRSFKGCGGGNYCTLRHNIWIHNMDLCGFTGKFQDEVSYFNQGCSCLTPLIFFFYASKFGFFKIFGYMRFFKKTKLKKLRALW